MTPKEVLVRIREAYPSLTLIGDTLQDIWHYGRLERPNPESSNGQVFRVSRTKRSPGGAAAVWWDLDVIFPLSTPVHRNFITASRGDANETRLVDEDTGKIVSPRISEHPTYPLTWSKGKICHPNIIISDYHRGLLRWETLNVLAGEFSSRRVVFSPSIWTCRQTRELETREAIDLRIAQDWVWVMNLAEAGALSLAVFPDTSVVTAGSDRVTIDCKHTCTCSGLGYAPVTPVEVPHTSAIGDVFLAAFSCAYFSDVDPIDAVRFAVRCCEIVLRSGREGTHYLRPEDLEKL